MKRLFQCLLFGSLLLASCSRVMHPFGEQAERERAAQAGRVFDVAVDKRPLPDLSHSAPLPETLEYAFNASGEIEAAYRDWRAALERVPQAGALADPRLEFGTIFSANNIKSFADLFSSMMLGASQEFPAPGKRRARAEQELARAQKAGEDFRKAKYALQRNVIRAYAELALNAEMTALTSETLRLFRQTHEVAAHRFHFGTETILADMKKIEIEIQTSESEQRALALEREKLTADLNSILNRRPDMPFAAVTIPAIQMTSATQEELFARAIAGNPELAAQRKEIATRGVAQTLAELERRPDFMISGRVEYPLLTPTKTLMPELGAGITLPINRQRIRAGIAEALQMRQAAEARYRAMESNTLARLVMALVAIRDTMRIENDYRTRIIPQAEELLDAQLSSYGSGGGELLDILDTERTLIDFKKLLLRARSDRLRFISELEEIIGDDLFKFIPAEMSTEKAS